MNKMSKKIYLGGTCNESAWRKELIEYLNKAKIEYFNPVVDDWTQECMKEEIKQRGLCNFCLCVITPKMTGVYSIAEVVDDSNKRPNKTIFLLLRDDGKKHFNKREWFSLKSVERMVKQNGAQVCYNYKDIIKYIIES
jgi:hypothetical protein